VTEPTAAKKPRIFTMPFARVYPEYVNKAAKKGRSQEEVDQVIEWLTGYDDAGLKATLDAETPIEAFYAEAPAMNPARSQITGTICGVRVETIEDPTMQAIRQLDKLIDELAKGKPMEKVLRSS
jgi:hypothetical protein